MALILPVSAQTTEIIAANIAQDRMLAKWLSDSTLPIRAQIAATLKQRYEQAPEAEKNAIPSGAACTHKMVKMMQDDYITPEILKEYNFVSIQEKQMEVPFVVFLHSNDGQKYLEQRFNAHEAFAKISLESFGDDVKIEEATTVLQTELETTQTIISKQNNAKELEVGQFGITLISNLTIHKNISPAFIDTLMEKVAAEPECQAMKKESEAYEVVIGKRVQ